LTVKLPDHIFKMVIADYDDEKATLKESVRSMEQTFEKVRNAETDADRFVKLVRQYAGCEELNLTTLCSMN